MLNCTNCGAISDGNDKFCSKCGKNLKQTKTEIDFFVCPGKLTIKRAGHIKGRRSESGGKGAIIGAIVGAPIGLSSVGAYLGGGAGVIMGGERNPTVAEKNGTLRLTNVAISCDDWKINYKKILTISKQGRLSKSIDINVLLDRNSLSSNLENQSALNDETIMEIELKSPNIDSLYDATVLMKKEQN